MNWTRPLQKFMYALKQLWEKKGWKNVFLNVEPMISTIPVHVFTSISLSSSGTVVYCELQNYLLA